MTYDKSFPADTTLIKDIPSSIRKKGEELYYLIKDIEEHRSTASIKTSIDTYPYLNELFVKDNTDIPRGLYFNHNNYWVGYNDYEYLPTDITGIEIGKRITLDSQTFELKETEGIKVWSNSRSFQPILFYDLFEYRNEPQLTADNRGVYKDNIQCNLENMEKIDEFLPYVQVKINSKFHTLNPFACPYSFTFSALFKNIKRTYPDKSDMDASHNAILFYIKDEFSNVNLSLAYDKRNHLWFFNKDRGTDLDFIISENVTYQITLQYINGHMDVIIDNKKIQSFPIELKDKMLYFSIGNDMNYGKYANGSFIVGEPSIYTQALSFEELLYTRDYPRTWNFNRRNGYLDLTLDEKIKLKKMLIEE